MKKLLAMLPLVAVLAGCSASMRSGASVYVVREPSVPPAYSCSYAWYGCPLPPLHAWIGLGWMNPFCYYGYYMSCCRRYGVGEFDPEESDGVFYDKTIPSDGPKKMKVTPKARVMKPGRKYEVKVSGDKPVLRPDRELGRLGRWSSAPRSEKLPVSSRESSSREAKSSRSSKKK